MKISDITRKQFIELFYSFLLAAEYNYLIGDSLELMELFIKEFEFEGD